jgi:hypothetical protein
LILTQPNAGVTKILCLVAQGDRKFRFDGFALVLFRQKNRPIFVCRQARRAAAAAAGIGPKRALFMKINLNETKALQPFIDPYP